MGQIRAEVREELLFCTRYKLSKGTLAGPFDHHGEIAIPTLEDLRKCFDFISKHQHKGVPGVLRIDSPSPGPVLAIAMCTHGNEPSGLAALWYCLKDNFALDNLERGSVIFILNNIKATAIGFNAPTPEDQIRSRFLDINLNRLPDDIAVILKRSNDPRYEIKRCIELYNNIYSDIDYALDIHSTSQHCRPMIIDLYKSSKQLYHGMPIPTVITNYSGIKSATALTELYGGLDNDIPVVAIETGLHRDSASFRNAITASLAVMEDLKMIRAPIKDQKRVFLEYKLTKAIRFPNETYRFCKVFANFETVRKGQLLARGDQGEFRCPKDGLALFAWPTLEPPFGSTEEAMFIADPALAREY